MKKRLSMLIRSGLNLYYHLVPCIPSRSFTVFALMALVLIASSACNPLQGGIKVYPGAGKGEVQETTPPPATPLTQSPVPTNNPTERQVTVTAGNSVFSIGMPAGYTEERQVTAQKPIDFWFEYLPTDNVTLAINGIATQMPARQGSARLGYTSNVTSFSYVIKNSSLQAISYNLHMAPSKAGDSVIVVTTEKWSAP
jgi:hypothetical protein